MANPAEVILVRQCPVPSTSLYLSGKCSAMANVSIPSRSVGQHSMKLRSVTRPRGVRAQATAEPVTATPQASEGSSSSVTEAVEKSSLDSVGGKDENGRLANNELGNGAAAEGSSNGSAVAEAASAEAIPDSSPEKNLKSARKARDWEKARDLLRKGRLWKSRVEALNAGGARLRLGSLSAFLPFSQMQPRKLGPGESRAQALMGQELLVQVLEADEAAGRLLVSEKAAAKKVKLEKLKQGQVLQGVVKAVADYGAFVDINDPDGSPMGVRGLVHVSELSWDPVLNVASAVAVGQNVSVKILRIDWQRTRLALSMKQVEADPLSVTLNALLHSSPAGDGEGSFNGAANAAPSLSSLSPQQPVAEELLGAPLPGLADLCDQLRNQHGVLEVSLGRQALERRVVSQDLELWLSSAPPLDNVFTLVARAGRQVQEVFVKTSLDRQGMKEAVLNVTRWDV